VSFHPFQCLPEAADEAFVGGAAPSCGRHPETAPRMVGRHSAAATASISFLLTVEALVSVSLGAVSRDSAWHTVDSELHDDCTCTSDDRCDGGGVVELASLRGAPELADEHTGAAATGTTLQTAPGALELRRWARTGRYMCEKSKNVLLWPGDTNSIVNH